jgi:hypothetical protein
MRAPRVSLLRSLNGFDCDGFNLNLSAQNMIEPVNYEIVSGPNGPQTLPGPNAGHVDYGSYFIRATDACGIVKTQSFTENLIGPVFESMVETVSTCYQGMARAQIILDANSTDNIAPPITVNFLDYPAEYVGPNPYTSNSSSTSLYIDQMAIGHYELEIEDGCGMKDTFEIDITIGLDASIETVLIPGCINNNEINSTYISNGSNAFGSPWSLYTLGTTTRVQGPNSSGIFVNVPPGEYYVEYVKCNNLRLRDTVQIDPYIQPDMDPIIGITCLDGSITITSSPTGGIEPYMYEIISGPAGHTYPIGPQSSPTFSGLTAGTNYRMRIFDDCGNSSSGDVSVVPELNPQVEEIGESCLGEPYTLQVVKPLIDAVYTWTLPDGSMVSGTKIQITELTPLHEGSYTLSVELGICATDETTFEINFGNCTLPLEWKSFTANQNEDYINLAWITLSEINVSHFEVLKSTDGINWKTIHDAMAKGQLSENRYQYKDFDISKSGINYYKIKQIDADGNYTFSIIKTVSFHDGEKEFLVSPNPSTGALNIEFEYNEKEAYLLNIFHLDGRLISSQELTESNSRFNFDQLDNGVYIVQLQSKIDGFINTKKWVKQ